MTYLDPKRWPALCGILAKPVDDESEPGAYLMHVFPEDGSLEAVARAELDALIREKQAEALESAARICVDAGDHMAAHRLDVHAASLRKGGGE